MVSKQKGDFIKKIKLTGAVLLVIAFFLPLSRCDTASWQRIDAEQAGLPTENIEPSYEYFYAWQIFAPDEVQDFEPGLALLVVLAFTWPVLFLVVRKKTRNLKANTGLLFLEPVIAAGGSYFVLILNMFNELYIGFYVAMLGAFLFFVGSVTEIVERFKRRRE